MTDTDIDFSVCKGLMFKGMMFDMTVTFHIQIAVVMQMICFWER